jgi:hypothetical protein
MEEGARVHGTIESQSFCSFEISGVTLWTTLGWIELGHTVQDGLMEQDVLSMFIKIELYCTHPQIPHIPEIVECGTLRRPHNA